MLYSKVFRELKTSQFVFHTRMQDIILEISRGGVEGSTTAVPQSGIFAHTMSVWCNPDGFSTSLYHEYSHAAMIRAWGFVLVAPHYPEARLEHEVAHCWQLLSTWSSLCSNKVDPSVLGVFVTTTTPLPGIPYNAITSTYHISLLHEWQDSTCEISKRIFFDQPSTLLHVSDA